MAKSKRNMEQSFDDLQNELLEREVPLKDCIDLLQEQKRYADDVVMETNITFVAKLFNLAYTEVEDAVSGSEYWANV